MINLNFTKRPFLWQIRLYFSLILVFFILFFLFLKIVPSGHISYSRVWPSNLRSGKGFIYGFYPAERSKLDNESWKIMAEPVYFSLFTPRPFDKAKVTIEYRNQLKSETPIIELGVLKDEISGYYDLKPLENKIIDDLSSVWSKINIKNTSSTISALWQIDKKYNSWEEFERDFKNGNLSNCPDGPSSCLVTYNYPLANSNRLFDVATTSPVIINQPLRGAHQFYVYLDGKKSYFDFDFVDLNQDKERDPITVNLWSNDKLVISQSLEDAGSALGTVKEERKNLSLAIPDLEVGVYRLEINISDDIVIARIKSPSDRLSFINKLWPVSASAPVTIFSDSASLQVTTFNPASLGKIYFAGKNIAINETYRQFSFLTAKAPTEIKLTKADVILETNGVFAFDSSQLINPTLKKIDRYYRSSSKIKYVLSNYTSPATKGENKIVSAEFDLRQAVRANGKYTFLISIPGLDGRAATSTYLEIKKISIDLNGKTLWQRIFR